MGVLFNFSLSAVVANGFDILIDKNGKPWLLEVNHAPSFNCDTPLDQNVKKSLLIDTFKILRCTLKEKN